MKRLRAAAMVATLAACAQPPAPQVEPTPQGDGVLPGTIGIVVRDERSRVVVAAVGKRSPAAESGVTVGDVVLSCNGEAVTSSRQFNRLVVDSPPGSRMRLELEREGRVRTLDVPVEQLDLTPRV